MLKRILIVLETLLLIAACGFGIWTYLEKAKVIADRDTLISQNAQLQQSIDAIGPLVNVYTVKVQMIANTPVMEDDLVMMTVPATAVPADAITDVSQIKYTDPVTGAKDFKYYKVTVSPQTMLTQDLLMNEDYTQPLYERDIPLEWLPIGLKAHDCIDIRVSYPDGTDLVVFSHKRVYMVLDNIIKLKLTYPELVRYTSLQTEKNYYDASSLGIRVYATAYIEPGLTKDTKPQILYPVSEGSAIMVQRDPNVKNKNELINAKLREYLDKKMAVYVQNDEGFGIYSKSSMVSTESGRLTQGMEAYNEMYVMLEQGEGIEQPTDLTGTGWDGEIVNGGVPYKRPDGSGSELEETTDGGLGSGLGDGGIVSGTESLGSVSQDFNQAVNNSADQLESAANQIQQNPTDFTQTSPTVSDSIPQMDMPVADSPSESQSAESETTSSTQAASETEAPTSVETQAAVDSAGNPQSITDESKEAARQSGNLFDMNRTLD